MKSKTFYLIAICFVVPTLIIVGLYHVSSAINYHPNSFIRLFPPHLATRTGETDLKLNSYYIAGTDQYDVYCGNFTAPNSVLKFDYDLKNAQSSDLIIPNEVRFVEGAASITVRNRDVYFIEGRSQILLKGSLDSRSVNMPMLTPYFMAATPFQANSALLKIYDNVKKQASLVKLYNGVTIEGKTPVLSRQVDGLFCTDGMMKYDPVSNRTVYAYYYRNSFIVLDTSVNILYEGRTIDTTRIANIKLDTLKKTNTVTLSAPPKLINKNISVSDKWIFIQSAQMARNENRKAFSNCSVIDVYSLQNGKYNFSFYLPDFAEAKVSDFHVTGNRLFAIQGDYLLSYHLAF